MKNPLDDYTDEELLEMEQIHQRLQNRELLTTLHEAIMAVRMYALVAEMSEYIQQMIVKDKPPSIWFGNS